MVKTTYIFFKNVFRTMKFTNFLNILLFACTEYIAPIFSSIGVLEMAMSVAPSVRWYVTSSFLAAFSACSGSF